ncbi:flagellar hook-associated protein FlgK [Castellaniella sp.]|uniref:flagellar hook-associated protein FlgK n=1 Tax=Castellaniella sp. TaxID=1955812 RepID=UPI00355DA03C
MNLANIGQSGLLAAQNRLQTTGHNITNAATPGYSRQQVLVETAGASASSAGWIGRGVRAVTVQRAYDAFLSSQLMQARTRGAALAAYGDQVAQINNLVADRSTGISPALQQFFDGLQAVASAPADIAARQELLGRADSLVSQLRQANDFLNEQRVNLNEQVSTTVQQANSLLDRIQMLNQKITAAGASATGMPPNDLFDQRDELLAGLGELINVRVIEQDGQVSLDAGNGQLLLAGDAVFHLRATPAPASAARLTVSVEIPDGHGGLVPLALDETAITGGRLGGLLEFRRDVLDKTQDDLGRLAVGLAQSVNRQHAQGYDLSGQPGADIFSIGAPQARAFGGNSTNLVPAVVHEDAAGLTGSNYEVRFDGAQYTVTRQSDGIQVALIAPGDGPVSFDGLQIDVTGLPAQAGDGWLIEPVRDAVVGLHLVLQDPAQFAAAGLGADQLPAGTANGDNALKMAQLQLAKVIGGSGQAGPGQGSMSLNEAYARLVNTVAVKTQANQTAIKAQDALYQQSHAAQQAVSGVNLDEEFILLQRFQEQYRASARLIDAASSMFDTLLGLRA